jgi:hypothetical protein
MASLDHIDAGEAVIGQAKTLIRGQLRTSPKLEQLASLLKEFEDVVPHRPRLQVSISCAEFDFEINVIPHEKIPSKVVYKMSLLSKRNCGVSWMS